MMVWYKMAFQDSQQPTSQQVSQNTKKASGCDFTSPVWGFAKPHTQKATWNPRLLRLELLRLDVFGMCLHRHYCDCQPTVAGRVFGYPKGRWGGGCGLHWLHIPKSRGPIFFVGMTGPHKKKRFKSGIFRPERMVQRYFSYNEPLKKLCGKWDASNFLVPWDAWANESCFVTVK